MALRGSLGQRSRSVSDGCRNIVNSTVVEPLKGVALKGHELFTFSKVQQKTTFLRMHFHGVGIPTDGSLSTSI